jgi:hypothetical protein
MRLLELGVVIVAVMVGRLEGVVIVRVVRLVVMVPPTGGRSLVDCCWSLVWALT